MEGIQEQEKELIDGWRKLGPESKRLVMSTVITAVTAEIENEADARINGKHGKGAVTP